MVWWKIFPLPRFGKTSNKLDRAHLYYLQCQLQIHVTGGKYCDFIVWHASGLHTERLLPDHQRIGEILPKVEQFFRLCVLPELVGKWFTRRKALLVASCPIEDDDNEKWCDCKESKGGVMIGCDDRQCSIKWFHTACLKKQEPPAGRWLCPSCHPEGRRKPYPSMHNISLSAGNDYITSITYVVHNIHNRTGPLFFELYRYPVVWC